MSWVCGRREKDGGSNVPVQFTCTQLPEEGLGRREKAGSGWRGGYGKSKGDVGRGEWGERWRGGVGTFQNQHPFREMITVDYLKEILGKAPNSRKSHSLGKRLQ